jgi:hypothetical protein
MGSLSSPSLSSLHHRTHGSFFATVRALHSMNPPVLKFAIKWYNPGAIALGSSLSSMPDHPNCLAVEGAGLLQAPPVNASTPLQQSPLSSEFPTASRSPPHPWTPMPSSEQVAYVCEGVGGGWSTWDDGRFVAPVIRDTMYLRTADMHVTRC